MIQLLLGNYKSSELKALTNALVRAYDGLDCEQIHDCEKCENKKVCKDLDFAIQFVTDTLAERGEIPG